MKCTIQGCPGEYEEKNIFHSLRYKGQIKVFDNVPAEVCDVCGDVLLRPETVEKIEKRLQDSKQSEAFAPLYKYA